MIEFSNKIYSDFFEYKKSIRGNIARVFVVGALEESQRQKVVGDLIKTHAPDWHHKSLLGKLKEVLHFSGTYGPVWIVARRRIKAVHAKGSFLESDYAWYREQVGSLLGFFKAYELTEFQFQWLKSNLEQEEASLLGLNLAAFQFKTQNDEKYLGTLPRLNHDKIWRADFMRNLMAKTRAINLAKYLVSLPPSEKAPMSFSQFVDKSFSGRKGLHLEIWDEKRLKKEKMGLHVGVGQAGSEPPCMIHLSYRPKAKSSHRPIAFVGKGVTFDTGGLDLKPSSAMRLMKKDMGGAAAVLGLALWAQESQYGRPLDFYLGLAENSVDSKSMRPSDVLKSRNGMTVEIHNTDAEGRLVLADVLDVAVKQKDNAEIVIDVATLTGAIKVALGNDVAGLFSNDDKLATSLGIAGHKAGDLNWRMPLYPKYASGMSSPFADIVNAVDSMGGAITAALFLEKFVGDKKWAHLDIFAWADKASGSQSTAGGNGQGVQCLIQWLSDYTN